MENVIAIIIIVLIASGAGLYIWRAKKKGAKCIGCPHSAHCPSAGKCNCANKSAGETNGK